ncbi:hypothetical protein [Trueperella pyogenes]|uniref:hypothetical protein n=1 Tax=Trueperella pyogenes TaxID=1661 RepID=UPI0011803417|nr:hypothetical protein [Trueperella pyogenes]
MTKRASWQGFIAAVIGEESYFALVQVILGQARWDSIPGLSQKKSAKTLELLRPYLHSPDGKEIRICENFLNPQTRTIPVRIRPSSLSLFLMT